MKKLLATGASLLVFAALGLAIGSLPWRPSSRSAPPRVEVLTAGDGALRAGAASVALDPPGPVPVAGFPRLRWNDRGRRDPTGARAIVLSEHGCQVGLVSVEILLVPGELSRAVEERVRDLRLDHLVLGATHTHAGPGGYWKDPLGQRIATGPYDARILGHLADRIAQALRAAAAAQAPASLSVATGEARELVRNRTAELVDGRLVAVRLLGPSGALIAQLAVFPSHATLLGAENRLLSGDWPGAFMRLSGEPLLFFQGALGDQTPQPTGEADRVESYARALGARMAALAWSRPDPSPPLAVATAVAVLPPPRPGAVPPLLRRAAANLLHGWFPVRGQVAAVRLGPLVLLAVPAEPVAEVARRWREATGPGSEVVALAGDYLGYVETPERVAAGDGETVRTYYGPELADRLGAAAQLAAEAVRSLHRPREASVKAP